MLNNLRNIVAKVPTSINPKQMLAITKNAKENLSKI
jgi:hypothetical protein